MSYGYFDDDNKEYVITRPDTPLPWINYLGTKDFLWNNLQYWWGLQFLSRCKTSAFNKISL